MTLALDELDAVTRRHMLAALEDDAASGRLEIQGLLTHEGRKKYVECLRDAVRSGNELTLARSLQNPAWWEERDGHGAPAAIERAAARLAATSFAALYTAGMCLRLAKEGERLCRIYHAGTGAEPECPGSRLEGAVVSVSDVLVWCKRNDRSGLRIPFAPDCCHSICRIGSVMTPSCPECGTSLCYGAITQKYSCVACMYTTTHEEMLRNPATRGPRRVRAGAMGHSPPSVTLVNSSESPVLLAICARGHIVDSMVGEPSAYSGKFCPTCGHLVSVSCHECGSRIRQEPVGAPVSALPAGARPPNHCTECAARFPWATRTRCARQMCSDAWERLCGVPWVRRHSKAICTVIFVGAAITGVVNFVLQFWK